MEPVAQKLALLQAAFARLQKVVLAYSGGVDSALLLQVGNDVLGENLLAVTADSPSLPRAELRYAGEFARALAANHLVMQTDEMSQAGYSENPVNRCYFCKFELYSKLKQVAHTHGFRYIANGTNLDDLGDYRPGLTAASEFEVVSPLSEAGFRKEDVRALARHLGLKVWDKPAAPCLASRLPYGSAVTTDKLAMVEEAESFLRSLNLRQIRVRHFGVKARVETEAADFPTVQRNYQRITAKLTSLGWQEVEWGGFRSGALNEDLGAAENGVHVRDVSASSEGG